MKADRPTVIVYCDHLLYASETFIPAQAEKLKEFIPVYAGLRRVKGLILPEDRTSVINAGSAFGSLKELAFKLMGVAPELISTLAARHPRLLHAHFGADGLRALPLAKKLGVPLIVSFHGSDATTTEIVNTQVPYGHKQYLARRPELQRSAAQFIAVSKFVSSKLLEQGFPEDKLLVHYIGIDTKLFSPIQSEPGPFVLFVGRLTERKGVDFLILAMAEVQEQYPELELIVIGDGHLRTELEALAKAKLRRYRFLGSQTAEVVREWIGKCRLLAAPSIKKDSGEEEGFGMVFIEAQAMEKPVVSFRSGGIGEAVEDGVTGLLASERDWRALAANIAFLANDRDVCQRMGVAGRERVLRMFDLEKQTAVLEKIYWNVVATPQAHG